MSDPDEIRSLLRQVRESGDVIESSAPALDIEDKALALRRAAVARSLLSPGNASEQMLILAGDRIEDESPPFDFEIGVARLAELASDRGLLNSAVESADKGEMLAPPGMTSEPSVIHDMPASLEFRDRVAQLAADVSIRNLAVKYAGNRNLAMEALEATHSRVASVNNPSRIADLRKYFCRVLQRKVVQLLESADTLSYDIEQHVHRESVSRSPVDGKAVRAAQVAQWQGVLAAESHKIVPPRSPHPEQYQEAIVRAARWVLATPRDGELDPTHLDQLLRQEYPQWFDAADGTIASYHQRLSRGRRDVRSLLNSAIGCEDLLA